MRTRALLAVALAVAVWAAHTALVSAQAGPYALIIVNETGQDLDVYIYNRWDPLKWSHCNSLFHSWLGDVWGGMKELRANTTMYVPDAEWPGCGAWSEYYIKVYVAGTERMKEYYAKKGDTLTVAPWW